MTVTSTGLTKSAGVCAAIAGTFYGLVQIKHPSATVAHLQGTNVQVRMYFKIAFAALALVGFAGMFAVSRRRMSKLGVAGYALVSAGYLALFAVECVVGIVMPTKATSNPTYVQHVLNAAMGHGVHTGIGALQILFLGAGVGYALGGLVFGIALYRAGVLARWASALFAVGSIGALALAHLPESYSRPWAEPVAIALIGLGISLYRSQTRPAVAAASSVAQVEPATV